MTKFAVAAVAALLLSLPATDGFSGAVGSCNLGDATCPNWTVASGGSNAWTHTVSVQGASPQGVAADDVVFWNADSFNADQSSQITAVVGVSNGYIGPAVRLTAGANGYAFGCEIGRASCRERVCLVV